MELFFEHFKNEHVLSKIDVRVKLLVALTLLAMVISYKGFFFPLLIIVLSFLLGAMLQIPLRVFVMRLLEPLFIVTMVLFLKFFSSGSFPLFSISIFGLEIAGYRDGLMEGLTIGIRIIGAVSILTIMGFCTPFTEFIAGLSWLRVPKSFIEVLMFAYRFLFVLLEDALVIYSAQRNRLGYSNIRRGMGSFGILAGSLILKAFDHSHNITTAMIQRGYDGNIPIMKHRPFKPSEVIVSVLIVMAMGWVWKIQ